MTGRCGRENNCSHKDEQERGHLKKWFSTWGQRAPGSLLSLASDYITRYKCVKGLNVIHGECVRDELPWASGILGLEQIGNHCTRAYFQTTILITFFFFLWPRISHSYHLYSQTIRNVAGSYVPWPLPPPPPTITNYRDDRPILGTFLENIALLMLVVISEVSAATSCIFLVGRGEEHEHVHAADYPVLCAASSNRSTGFPQVLIY